MGAVTGERTAAYVAIDSLMGAMSRPGKKYSGVGCHIYFSNASTSLGGHFTVTHSRLPQKIGGASKVKHSK